MTDAVNWFISACRGLYKGNLVSAFHSFVCGWWRIHVCYCLNDCSARYYDWYASHPSNKSGSDGYMPEGEYTLTYFFSKTKSAFLNQNKTIKSYLSINESVYHFCTLGKVKSALLILASHNQVRNFYASSHVACGRLRTWCAWLMQKLYCQ